MLEIRPFTQEDYQTIARLEMSIFSDEVLTAESIQEEDQHNPLHIKQERFLAWYSGLAVGFAHLTQDAWQYHPQRFIFWVVVHPDFQRQSIGTQLWQKLLEAVAAYNPISISASTREDCFGLEFLKKRGLLEKMRTWENRIEVQDFDPSPYGNLKHQLETQAIQILSAAQLQNLHPDFALRYYQLNTDTEHDVPRAYTATVPTFKEWKSVNLQSPKVLLEGTFMALHGLEYVGMSQLFKSDSDYLTIGLTGVRREYRAKHIALALKVACLEWAKNNGYAEIRTWNDSHNQAILALNKKLGFTQCPAWIECIKE